MTHIEIPKTIKLQFKVCTAADATALCQTMRAYRQACQAASQYIFDHDFELRQLNLHQALYQELRTQFGLKAQMAQSVLRTVTARYRAVRTQLRERPYRYRDEQGQYREIVKDLTWLWQPVQFHRPQLDLVRGRDWSLKKTGQLSLNTCQGRIADMNKLVGQSTNWRPF